MVALDGRDLQLVDLDSGELDDRFPPTDVTLSDRPVRNPSELGVSADGRFVVHMTTTESPKHASTPKLRGRPTTVPCVTFSVYELAGGRRVIGPITPSFGAGDVAINADGSLVAVAGGY